MPDLPRLWSWNLSPFAGKARIAFAEKNVEVDLVEIDPANRPARLKEINLLAKVPTLELPGGLVVRESSIICEWLEDTAPEPPLWPTEPDARAWARSWANWIDDAIALNFFLGMRKQFFGLAPGDPEDVVAQLHGRVVKLYGKLEPVLDEHDGPWLCGEQFTFADVSCMAAAVRIPQWKPELAPDATVTPLVAAWFDALRARPSAEEIDRVGTPHAD